MPLKFRYKFKPLLLLLFLFAVSVSAQKRCRIFGNVRDEKGSAIELASVRIQGTSNLTVTNLKGHYALHANVGDSLTVVFSMIGYETRRRQVVASGDSVRLDVMLPQYGATTFGEAVVTGQGVQTGTTQKIRPVDAHRMPSTTGNAVEEIIATQAGVSTHNELSSQYNVRGGSFDENCVYINGVEVYRPMLVRSGQQEGLSIINSDMVEGIAFSSGGFEARYGDRMSSVLDITYKRPEKFEATATASFLGAGAYVGWGNKHVSLMTSVRYKTTGYLLGTLDTKGEYRPKYLDYQAFLSWRPNKHWSFEALGNISDNNYRFVPEERETKFGTMNDAKNFRVYFDGQEKDFFRTYFAAFSLTRHFNANTFLALQYSAFTTHEQENYDIQGEYWLNESQSNAQLGVGTYMEHARNRLQARVSDVGLRFRTRFTAHTLQLGFDYKREHIRENASQWEMRDSMGHSLPTDPDRLMLIYSERSKNEITTNRLEAYLQDTWRIKSDIGLFNLNYGLRLSHWDWNKETLLSPRLSLGLLPAFNDRWTFRLATGYYYQAPFYKELRDTVIRAGLSTVTLLKDIRSQRSVHFVIGGDYTFRMNNRPFRFTAEAYYKALSNLIPYTVDNMRIVYAGGNSSKGYAAGVDFKLFGEFVTGTDSWVTLSLMRTKEKIGDLWVPRPTDQRYALSLFFTDYFPGTDRWRVTLKAALADGLPFGAPHSSKENFTFRAPAYKRIDLGMSYRLCGGDNPKQRRRAWRNVKNAWLGLDAFNLWGISNVNSYYWVTDISNTQYAVPNYLTGLLLNLRLSLEF